VNPPPTATAPDSTSPPAPDRYPIVVVEDDEAIRTLLHRLLTSQGYLVHAHSEAESALERMRALGAAILLVDRMLPGMTGVDLIERIREIRHDFESVLVTAYADVEALRRSLRLGVFRCLLKPFHNDDVLAAVAGAANRLWLRLDLRARASELETRNAQLEKTVAQLHEMEKRRTLEERLASIGRLAAGVAHEINTPLASVIANLSLMEDQLKDIEASSGSGSLRETVETLADAREAADRVRVIVRDLKTFSRSDDEKIGPVDVRRVVEATLNMVWNEIRHRARLVKDFSPVPNVRANDARLGQIVLNLLLNAAQAIPEGNVENNEIRVVTRASGDYVVLEVRDTGSGIQREDLGRVFEPFFTTKAIGVGTGLGLSISHGIVTSLGGRIEVESEPRTGTTFRVLLPIANAQSPEPSTPTPPPTEVRPRVLAIDDDELILSTLSRVLRKECDVVTVTSAREALERVGADTFDVILCDLMMPQMTGMELHAVLMSAAPREAEKMIFLTGGTFTPRAQNFLDSVPNLRLEKPFDPKQLRAIIQDCAKRRRDAAAGAADAKGPPSS
jgi:signal transduction histidine kinase